MKQIAARGRTAVDEQHAIDADAGRSQLGHAAGLPLADFWNAIASFKVKRHITIAA